ncbi:inositol-tetrakisphosphate 1-kinase 3-like protein isoform X4 [Tanacetum coccineum]|uniref:Inositol-tetrakisphosphate 1-kinase 3-like protein isoform X4 n=1 Tax=Tanacetum coccineum TaxID=301880 RepID=A0ABQ5EUH9_9ASTR
MPPSFLPGIRRNDTSAAIFSPWIVGSHSEVTVLDSLRAIQHFYNRQSMLQDVAHLDFSNVYGTIGVPRQLVIEKDPSSPDYLFLLLRMVDKSHELSLAYDVVTMKMKKTNAGVHSPIAIRHILPLGA